MFASIISSFIFLLSFFFYFIYLFIYLFIYYLFVGVVIYLLSFCGCGGGHVLIQVFCKDKPEPGG